jgi:hypothetical protein
MQIIQRILELRKMKLWEEFTQKSSVWRVVLAWARRKKEDVGKGQEYGQDQREALRELLQDVENRVKAGFIQSSGWYFYTVPDSIEGSITNAIEQEYDCLCHHPRFHNGRTVRCCIRKHLFNEMLEELPELPPVRKLSEHRGYETDTNHVANVKVTHRNEVGGVRSGIEHMEGDPRLGTAQNGGHWKLGRIQR